jgi:hypothetical protein
MTTKMLNVIITDGKEAHNGQSRHDLKPYVVVLLNNPEQLILPSQQQAIENVHLAEIKLTLETEAMELSRALAMA